MKHIILSALTIFTITLAACSSSSSAAPTSSTQATNELPTETQLGLGSLKLEETEYAITGDQADDLLPMWQIYEELTSSDTAAQEEVDALIEQIQETMTSEQMQAISDMQLTQQDIFTAMQGTVSTSSQSGSSITVPSGSGMSAGGPPDGGRGAPSDMGGGMPDSLGGGATDATQSTQTGSSIQQISGVPTALVEALIQSLEQKIAAVPTSSA